MSRKSNNRLRVTQFFIDHAKQFIPRHHKLNFPIRQKDVPTLKIKEAKDVDSVQ